MESNHTIFNKKLNNTNKMKFFQNTIILGIIILFPLTIIAQNKPEINATVTGKIEDSKTSEPIIGANITIKGTTNGAVSDVNGEFGLITGQKLPFTLIISYTGYQKQEFFISENKVVLKLQENVNQLEDVLVTSRRRQESIQEIPIPITLIKGNKVAETGAFNPNRLKELIPSIQLYSSNGRNTTLNIRGLGSTFGLTNDGIDPGVGFYVDGVYYARPAATVIDFVDIEKVEVLRGPQSTLYGKNTTAGAFNITTKSPSFVANTSFETSYGNLNFIQAKASITGPLSKKMAARLSFTGTQRDGTIYNNNNLKNVNTLNNLGFRAQLLYNPTDKIKLLFIADNSRQRPDGNATVVAGVVKTKRAAYRQFDAIIADLGYTLPSKNPFDRVTDADAPLKVNNDYGGASLNVDIKAGNGKITATSAWRYWIWDPANDRDFIGLPVLTKSQGNSFHQQFTQEIRYAGSFSTKWSGVVGAFLMKQDLKSDPFQIEESGSAQWRFAQSTTSNLWSTPGLFDGFGTRTNSRLKTLGAAIFSQLDWKINDKIQLLTGIRYNYDQKDVNYNRVAYGGLQTNDPALLALKNALYTSQAFDFNVSENNITGLLTFLYKYNNKINGFLTVTNSYKPIGVNLGGLPTSNGVTLIELARVKPEYVTHFEIGIKSNPTKNSFLNLTLFNTDIKDYQTQVQTPEVGVNRGYLANAEKVRVKGFEFEGNLRLINKWVFNSSISYTDGKYVAFSNAPVPLEEVGGSQAFKDVSGGTLPGISKWATSIGAEYIHEGKLFDLNGKYFFAVDSFSRSDFSSSPSPSNFLNIEGYTLINARIGFRGSNGFSFMIWSRNVTDKNYFEQLLPAAGSSGLYAAVLGDQRTIGTTLRYSF